MANIYWMIEAGEEYEGVDDVKRRVAQAVRGVTKKKRLLSIMVIHFHYMVTYSKCTKELVRLINFI